MSRIIRRDVQVVTSRHVTNTWLMTIIRHGNTFPHPSSSSDQLEIRIICDDQWEAPKRQLHPSLANCIVKPRTAIVCFLQKQPFILSLNYTSCFFPPRIFIWGDKAPLKVVMLLGWWGNWTANDYTKPTVISHFSISDVAPRVLARDNARLGDGAGPVQRPEVLRVLGAWRPRLPWPRPRPHEVPGNIRGSARLVNLQTGEKTMYIILWSLQND